MKTTISATMTLQGSCRPVMKAVRSSIISLPTEIFAGRIRTAPPRRCRQDFCRTRTAPRLPWERMAPSVMPIGPASTGRHREAACVSRWWTAPARRCLFPAITFLSCAAPRTAAIWPLSVTAPCRQSCTGIPLIRRSRPRPTRWKSGAWRKMLPSVLRYKPLPSKIPIVQ